MIILTLHTAVPDCGELEIDDGSVNHPDGTLFNAVASYTCDNAFVLQGNSQRTCQVNATWSGSDPQCIAGLCIIPLYLYLYLIHTTQSVYFITSPPHS